MTVNKEELLVLIRDSLTAAERGLRAKAATNLRKVHGICNEHPFCLWETDEVFLLGKTYLVMYHFDVFDSEDQNIIIAHRALMYLQRAEELFKLSPGASGIPVFEVMKCQAVILKLCQDCFIGDVSQFYQPQQRKASAEEINGANMLAARVMPYVLYHVLLEITDRFNGFCGDAFLDDTCRDIEHEFPNISDKLIKEASNVRKLLYLQLIALDKRL